MTGLVKEELGGKGDGGGVLKGPPPPPPPTTRSETVEHKSSDSPEDAALHVVS